MVVDKYLNVFNEKNLKKVHLKVCFDFFEKLLVVVDKYLNVFNEKNLKKVHLKVFYYYIYYYFFRNIVVGG